MSQLLNNIKIGGGLDTDYVTPKLIKTCISCHPTINLFFNINHWQNIVPYIDKKRMDKGSLQILLIRF